MLIAKYSIFLCSLALSSAFLCFANDASVLKTELADPESQRQGYEQCVRKCQEWHPGSPEVCRQICQEQQGEGRREPWRREEECERRCSSDTRGQREQQECLQQCRGREGRRFQECSQRCDRQEKGQKQQECRARCQEEYKREQQRQGREHQRGRGGSEEADDELNRQDPHRRFQECSQSCERQERGQKQQDCRRRCQEEFEREERQEREHRGGGGDDNPRDPRRRYQECQEQCRRQQGSSRQQECQRKCQDEFRRESESEGRRGGEREEQGRGRREGVVGETGEEQDNPYLFHSGHFQESFRSSEGSLRFLPKFNSRSRLLRGLKHFRFAELQASPNTVYLPHHSDSDCVCVVTRGRGTITFVNHERKESFNIEQGNVIRVPAGNTLYLVNHESNEQLNVALFVNPVNNPGEFEDFYPAGSQNPQSYYRAFSTEILEQALNTPREQIERLFQGREGEQGIIRRASQEQLQAMSRHASSHRSKGRDIISPIDLTNQKPTYSNQNGRFFEANPDEFRQLEDIDISVGIVDLQQEAMFAPHYNSRTTYVVHVAEGEAQVEMACPHLGRGWREQDRSEEERSGEIQRVSFGVSAGDVFIIPAGHPFTMVATGNQNLRTVGFGVNARNNERIFLAGRENLMRQMDSEAKEVAFGVPARLVDEIFNNPKESYFLSRRGQQGRRDQEAGPLSSIVEKVARLF